MLVKLQKHFPGDGSQLDRSDSRSIQVLFSPLWFVCSFFFFFYRGLIYVSFFLVFFNRCHRSGPGTLPETSCYFVLAVGSTLESISAERARWQRSGV